MMAAISAARLGSSVLLLEKQSRAGAKLRASGGGRCNLTNTLKQKEFIVRFGREGKFMIPALKAMDQHALVEFFAEIGVECHAPDGFRIFPVTHQADTVAAALEAEIAKLKIKLLYGQKVERIDHDNSRVTGVTTSDQTYKATNLIIACGGPGYPALGADASGYDLAAALGHKVNELFPAMLPLRTRETWVKKCRADTVGKVEMRINLPEARKLRANGDLIFTENGIRGPVVLDFAREITPLLKRHGEVPLLVNLTQGKNEEQIRESLKKAYGSNKTSTVVDLLATFIKKPLARELCQLADIDPDSGYSMLQGQKRDELIKLLTWTPLTIVGHDGFATAMVTRGGISLKQICPETMQSKLMQGLYFCGEILDLDGPCGGFNLHWAFASGYLAGQLKNNRV